MPPLREAAKKRRTFFRIPYPSHFFPFLFIKECFLDNFPEVDVSTVICIKGSAEKHFKSTYNLIEGYSKGKIISMRLGEEQGFQFFLLIHTPGSSTIGYLTFRIRRSQVCRGGEGGTSREAKNNKINFLKTCWLKSSALPDGNT